MSRWRVLDEINWVGILKNLREVLLIFEASSMMIVTAPFLFLDDNGLFSILKNILL